MAKIQDIFKRLAEELDKEEKDELLEAMKGRKLTGAELLEAIKELPPESRKEVREALADVQEDLDNEDDDTDDDGKTPKKKKKLRAVDNDDDDTDDEDDDDKRKTRPGRKSGRAYDWTVEDGKVIRLDYAKVYSGEDEPDRVEITDEDEDDDDNEEDVA